MRHRLLHLKGDLFVQASLRDVRCRRSVAASLAVAAALALLPSIATRYANAQEASATDETTEVGEELTELRTQNIKFFQAADGSATAEIYAAPIHFRSDGEWREIDTSLKSSERPGYAFTNTRGPFRVDFAGSARSEEMVRIQSDGGGLSFGFAGASESAVGTVSGSQITYHDVRPGVDLVFDVTPEGVKESIVVHRRPDMVPSLSFPMVLDGLEARDREDGHTQLVDDDEQPIFTLPRGWMVEAEDTGADEPVTSDLVDIDLHSTAEGAVLSVVPDLSWLQDVDRNYPVVIDPTVETLDPSPDCHISSGTRADNTYCGFNYLKVGWDDSGKRRSLLKFPVSQLPEGAQVVDADLKLYLSDATTSNGASIDLHRAIQPWGEGVTWKRRTWDDLDTWNTNGGDFNSEVYATRTLAGGTPGYKAWDATSLTRGWLEGTFLNRGILLKQKSEGINNLLTFTSYQGAPSEWPTLEVEYADFSLDVAHWEADSSYGQTSYDFSIGASGLNHPPSADLNNAGPCHGAFSCRWKVFAKSSDGTISTFDSGSLAAGTPSFSKQFSGVAGLDITDLKFEIEPIGDYGNVNERWTSSPWINVSRPYPLPEVTLSVGRWSADNGSVSFDLSVSGTGLARTGGPCDTLNGCYWYVEGYQEVNGAKHLVSQLVSRQDVEGVTWSIADGASGSFSSSSQIDYLRATVREDTTSGGGIDSDYVRVSDLTLADIDAGELALLLASRNVTQEQLCITVQERATILRIPDATPHTSPHAATEACLTAAGLRGALIAIGAVVGGPAVIGAIIHYYDDGPNADSIAKVPAPETDTAGAGVRPPISCLTQQQIEDLIQELEDGNWQRNHHVATNKSPYWKAAFESLLAQRGYSTGQSLNGSWNIMKQLLHRGTHPPAYHFWIYRNLEKALRESSTWEEFSVKWKEWVLDVIKADPTIIRWEWWRC